jgi:hypothetical protein
MLCASEIYVYTIQLSELFPIIFKCPLQKKEVPFICNYLQAFTAKTRLFFLNHECGWFELSARCKTSSENTIFTCNRNFTRWTEHFAVHYPTEDLYFRVSVNQLPWHWDVRIVFCGWESVSLVSQGVCFMCNSWVPSCHPHAWQAASRI